MLIFLLFICRILPLFAMLVWQKCGKNLNGVYHFPGDLNRLIVGMGVYLGGD